MKNERLARRSGTRRVLLVDDYPEYRRLLERRLATRSGIEFLGCDNALAALTLLEEMPCDVVVSDMKMPGLDGKEFLDIVGRKWPDTRRLLLTAHSYGELVAACDFNVLDKGLSTTHIVDTIVRLAKVR